MTLRQLAAVAALVLFVFLLLSEFLVPWLFYVVLTWRDRWSGEWARIRRRCREAADLPHLPPLTDHVDYESLHAHRARLDATLRAEDCDGR